MLVATVLLTATTLLGGLSLVASPPSSPLGWGSGAALRVGLPGLLAATGALGLLAAGAGRQRLAAAAGRPFRPPGPPGAVRLRPGPLLGASAALPFLPGLAALGSITGYLPATALWPALLGGLLLGGVAIPVGVWSWPGLLARWVGPGGAAASLRVEAQLGSVLSWSLHTRWLITTGRLEEARGVLARFLDQPGWFGPPHLLPLARYWQAAGHPDYAQTLLYAAARLDPSNPEVLEALVEASLQCNEGSLELTQWAERALQEGSGWRWRWQRPGWTEQLRALQVQAEAAHRRSLGLRPSSTEGASRAAPPPFHPTAR